MGTVTDKTEGMSNSNQSINNMAKHSGVCLFMLRFYGPVNTMGSCQVRSVYLTTRLMGRLCPLSG